MTKVQREGIAYRFCSIRGNRLYASRQTAMVTAAIVLP